MLCGFHLVAGLYAGRFAFDCVYKEARDDLAVSGEVADVLLESALDAHVLTYIDVQDGKDR